MPRWRGEHVTPCTEPCKANGSSQLSLGGMGITSSPPYKTEDSTQLAARFKFF